MGSGPRRIPLSGRGKLPKTGIPRKDSCPRCPRGCGPVLGTCSVGFPIRSIGSAYVGITPFCRGTITFLIEREKTLPQEAGHFRAGVHR